VPLTSVGTAYEAELATFAERWQTGAIHDLRAGLRDVDRKINGLLRHPGVADAGPTGQSARAWLGSQPASADLRAALL
jgi:hypothetical protein